MYLFVFVFMLMGVLGLYTQVFMLQVDRSFANQAALGQTMLVYHNVSVRLARTYSTNVAALADGSFCFQTLGASSNVCSWGNLAIATSLPVSATALPMGFSSTYNFPSVVYAFGGAHYLITFVSPPAGNPAGAVAQPAVGFTVPQFYRQIRNTGISPFLYGQVKDGYFYTKAIVTDAGSPVPHIVKYPVLSTIGIANGSVGLISIL